MPEEVYGLGHGGGGGGANVSLIGNTDGTVQLISTGTWYLAGGNNITVSQDGQSVTIQGETNSGATTFLAGVSNLGNTLGTTGAINNRMAFVGSNNITLRQSTNAQSATITISGPPLGTPAYGVSNLGNSLGTTGMASGQSPRMVFVGGNNITLSQSLDAGVSSGTITISAGASGGSFSGGVSSGGNTAGTTGTVSNGILFVGGNNITLSQSSAAGGATVTISGANIGGAQTGISGVSASDTVYTSGTVKWSGSNIITVKSGAGQAVIIDATVPAQTVESQTLGMSNLGNSAGTSGVVSGGQVRYLFAGGNNITLSQSIDGVSGTVTISGANVGGAQTGISGIAGSAASTVTAGTVQFANSNGISFGLNGSTMTASHNALTSQSAQTGISGISGSNTVYTSGTVKFTGSNIITVRSGTGQAIVIDASVAAQTGISGIAGSGASTVTNGTVQFANSNGVSFGLNGSTMTASISVTGAGINITAAGNTTGTLALVSTGTLTLAGGNNITLSQAGNAITISAPSGGGAGVSTDGNTAGTTGTVDYQLVFVGGSNITLSQSVNGSSGTLTIIGASGGTGGNGNVISAGGNTSGTLTTFSTGTILFAGGNNITLSQSSNSITISGANIGGAQTGISSISVSDTVYTSGQVKFTGSNNITVLSGTGQQVIISGPTGGGAGMGSQGNTAGTTGTVGKELYFVGGSNISLSQSVNGASATLTINGATAGGGQTGISGISASDTVYTSGTVQWSGSNMITVKSGAGQAVIIDATQSVQPEGQDTIGMSNLGNTAGTTGVVNGSNLQFFFAGGNNITLSQSINGSSATLTISGPNVGGAQTGISGIADSASTVTVGTVQFQNSNGISFGLNGSTMTASHNGVTSQSNQQLTVYAGSQSFGTSSATINASSLVIAGSGDISVAVSNGSLIINAPADTGTGATNQLGMSNLGNTSGTSGVVNNAVWKYFLAGGNNVTLSQSLDAGSLSGTVTISAISVPSSSAYAAVVSNVSSAGSKTDRFALADHAHQGLAGVNFSGTASTFVGSLMISAGNNMTMSTGGNSTAGTIAFHNLLSSSAIAQPVSNVSSAGTQASRYALADHAHQGVAGINVSGTATTWVGNVMLSGTNITFVTGGNSTAGSIGISAAAPGGGGGAAVGMGATGNTSGNTFSSTSGSVFIQGTNNITVSGSTAAGSLNTIWVSGPTGGGAGMGTGTNTSGTSGTVGKELFFYGNSNIGLSQSVNGSSASLTLIGQAGAAGASVSEWMPPGIGYSSFTQMGQSTLIMFPVAAPYYVSASQANLWASISVSTSSNSSHSGVISLDVGIYTKNASTLSLASSGSTQHSWNVTGSTSSGSIVGWRALSVPINVNMTPGNYWIGVISRTATTNANWFTASNMGLIAAAAAYSGPLGATNNTNQMFLGGGVWSAQTAAMPASVAFSNITATSASTARPIINFVNLTV